MESTWNLNDAVVVITGASRGIGASAAIAFAKAGAKVAITSRDHDALNGVAKQIGDICGSECICHCGDVADVASTEAFYQSIFKKFGRLDCLFSNAGMLTEGFLGTISEADFERVLRVNVQGAVQHVQLAARLMRRRQAGSIILNSSIIGRCGNKGQVAYAASKAALLGVMSSAAKELGPCGIRVNAVAPGYIKTDMVEHLSDDNRKALIEKIALGRVGCPNDVSNVVLFLASPLSSYISGQIIGVDGCMTI